jgi:hypothetical protein
MRDSTTTSGSSPYVAGELRSRSRRYEPAAPCTHPGYDLGPKDPRDDRAQVLTIRTTRTASQATTRHHGMSRHG